MSYTAGYKKKDESYLKDLVLLSIPDRPCNISSRKIAQNTGIKDRDVRYIVQKLRDDGYPICATPDKGYWVAQASWELNETINKLKSHIDNCSATYHSLLESREKMKERENISDDK
nr:MAG TPA: winged helix-turn-helix protein [Caudoviricetes sp.]